MDATTWRRKRALIVVLGALVGRGDDPMPGPCISTHETVQSIGRRLSQSWSERDLTALATRGLEQYWTGYNPASEPRWGGATSGCTWIGRSSWRWRSRPVRSRSGWEIEASARRGENWSTPTQPGVSIDAASIRGRIELGVNGLDRTPVAHYVVFIRPIGQDPANGDRPVVTLDGGQEAHWRLAVARPDVSAAFDAWKPFQTLPEELERCRDAPGVTRPPTLGPAGHGPGVEDSRRFQPSTRSGHHRLRRRSARELVWTWRTSPDVETTALRVVRAPAGAGRMRPAGREPPPGEVRIVAGDSTCLEVPSVLNDPVVRRHRVRVSGLEPDTVYGYSLGDGTPVWVGALEDCEDGPRSGPSRPVPLPGRCPDRAGALGTSPGDGCARASRLRFPHAGRRPGRSRKRADQLGPPLPPGRAGLRPRAGDAVRGESRVPRCRSAPVSGRLRAAAQWAMGHRPGPGLFIRDRGRLLRRARQHARRLGPVGRAPTSRVA